MLILALGLVLFLACCFCFIFQLISLDLSSSFSFQRFWFWILSNKEHVSAAGSASADRISQSVWKHSGPAGSDGLDLDQIWRFGSGSGLMIWVNLVQRADGAAPVLLGFSCLQTTEAKISTTATVIQRPSVLWDQNFLNLVRNKDEMFPGPFGSEDKRFFESRRRMCLYLLDLLRSGPDPTRCFTLGTSPAPPRSSAAQRSVWFSLKTKRVQKTELVLFGGFDSLQNSTSGSVCPQRVRTWSEGGSVWGEGLCLYVGLVSGSGSWTRCWTRSRTVGREQKPVKTGRRRADVDPKLQNLLWLWAVLESWYQQNWPTFSSLVLLVFWSGSERNGLWFWRIHFSLWFFSHRALRFC